MDYRDFGKTHAADIIHSPYRPRPWQAVAHRDGHRFRVVVVHRRGGKTLFSVNEVMDRSLSLVRDNTDLAPPRYAFVAPTAKAAKDLGFKNLRTFLGDWTHKTIESEPASITYESQAMPGVEITVDFIGAHNLDAYRGRYLDGVVVDEFSEIPGNSWKGVIYPMLSDYKGWGVIIGTPKGRNQFYHRYRDAEKAKDWGRHYYPASKTGIVPQEELDDQLELMGPELYGQEYELDWLSATWGAYYGRLLYRAESLGRIGDVPHDPDFPVHTAWDLGLDGAMVTWFWQQIASQVRFIDHYETQGIGLEEYFDANIIGRKDAFGRQYRYGRHWFPHDLRHRELWSGKDRYELATKALAGNGTVHVVPRRSVEDGIEVARRLIPRCWFDRDNCSEGIDLLSLYRAKFDEKLGTGTKPLKDHTAHTADAFRQAALGITPLSGPLDQNAEGGERDEHSGLSMGAIMRKHGRPCPYYPGGGRRNEPLEDQYA